MPNSFVSASAKGAGKAKGAIASLRGLRGVFNTLVQQHGEVSTLLTRARMSSDPAKRIDLWSKIRTELLSHERAELRVVYPVLRARDETRAFAEEHDADAGELERSIFEIDGLDAASDAWADRLNGLIAQVKRHVEAEEKRYFPLAAHTLSKEESDRLNREFLAQKSVVVDEVALHRGTGTPTHVH